MSIVEPRLHCHKVKSLLYCLFKFKFIPHPSDYGDNTYKYNLNLSLKYWANIAPSLF